MSNFLNALYKVYDLVYDSVYGFEDFFKYIALKSKLLTSKKIMSKRDFSIPKIYTGGVNIGDWKLLSKERREQALKKKWFIYYDLRDPETGNLKRQTPITGSANSYKTKNERIQYLTVMRNALELMLVNGVRRGQDNDFSFLDQFSVSDSKTSDKAIKIQKTEETKIIQEDRETKIQPETTQIGNIVSTESSTESNGVSIEKAFEIVLKLKQNMMNDTSFHNFQLRIKRFMNFIPDTSLPVSSITKMDVVNFLNLILELTSPRNRNNYRTDLNSFFSELENNEFINHNFITKIKPLKSVPERNKTYSDQMQEDIFEYLQKNDNLLLLFIKFISYNFLRPVEICRLRIKDIDLVERKMYFKAKNQPVKTKIIPDILFDDIPDLSRLDPESFLFTPKGIGMKWEATENSRRNHFSQRFKEVVKDNFDLNKDYGLYSFRHTFITKLYKKLRETKSPQEAKSDLMLIVGHANISTVEKYLRDVDAELPPDFSHLLKKSNS